MGGLLLFCTLWVGFAFPGAESFVTIVQILWPAYKSILAIELPDSDRRKEQRLQWMTYWMLTGAINLLELSPIGYFLYLYLPVWLPIKLIILVFLSNPLNPGAITIYHLRLKPLLKKYGPAIKAIDEKMCEIYEDAKDSISGAKEKLKNHNEAVKNKAKDSDEDKKPVDHNEIELKEEKQD